MTTYVLVHGAWHGGWCWQRVADSLRHAGHEVFTPTLTGLGERAHERTPETGLRTHVDDIVTMLRAEDLRDVVLVGHSYAALVVREAADTVPERVGRIVLVDGWAGHDGASLDDMAPGFFGDWIESMTADGLIAIPPASQVGVHDPDQVAWLEPRLTPQPRRTFTERTTLTGAVDSIPCLAVLCTPKGPMPFAELAAELGCPTVEIESSHNAMITAPQALAGALLSAG